MKRLLRIELIKISQFPAFWVLICLHAVLFLLTAILLSRIDFGGQIPFNQFFGFPEAWSTMTWLASWFNLLLAILVIIMMGNEYSYRTFRQHIIDGLTRTELVTAKVIMIGVLLIYSFVIVTICTLILGFAYTDNLTIGAFVENLHYLGIYLIQALGYMSIGLFLVTVLRNLALSIVLYLLYFIIAEPVIRNFFPEQILVYFPFKIISGLTPPPYEQFIGQPQFQGSINGSTALQSGAQTAIETDLSVNTVVAIAYIAVFLSASYLIMNRRNL